MARLNSQEENPKDSITVDSNNSSILHRIAPEDLDKNAVSDLPISSIKDDKLGFDIYVRALKDFIASEDTATPLTIGIDSHWGTGKTSLMQMLRSELDPERSISFKVREFIIWFLWLVIYIITIPVWLMGKVLIVLATLVGKKGEKIEEIEKCLNLDLSIGSEETGKTKSISTKFWAFIGERHTPMISPYLPTVWFNAWKFDQEEILWAAMALTVFDELKKRQGAIGRLLFWLRLAMKRFSIFKIICMALPVVILSILLIGEVIKNPTVSNSILPLKHNLTYIEKFISILSIPSDSVYEWPIKISSLFAILILIYSQYSDYLAILRSPFHIPTNSLFDRNKYEDKIGFIGSFQEDFETIVSIANKPLFGKKPTKLVIFIDDLDRCKPPKAADIIQAINQFLDCPGCIFVIGMDSSAVVASIEIKYKKLFNKIKSENAESVSPGRFFLDKIVQVSFHIPEVTEKSMKEMVSSIACSKGVVLKSKKIDIKTELPEIKRTSSSDEKILQDNGPLAKDSVKSAFSGSKKKMQDLIKHDLIVKPDIASYNRGDIRNAILIGSRLLKNNPRQYKRFINQFRLMIFICQEKELLRERIISDSSEGLNLERLAIWVAWTIRWPDLVKNLFDSIWREEIREYLRSISDKLNDNGQWNLHEARFALIKERDEIGSIANHWLFLPWEQWLGENAFRESIKLLSCFWHNPEEEQDILEVLLTLTSSFQTPATHSSQYSMNPMKEESHEVGLWDRFSAKVSSNISRILDNPIDPIEFLDISYQNQLKFLQ